MTVEGQRRRIVDEFVRRIELVTPAPDAVLIGLRVMFGRGDSEGMVVSVLPRADRSTGDDSQRLTLTRILPVVVEVNQIVSASVDGRAEWHAVESTLARIVEIIEVPPPSGYTVSGGVDREQHWRRFSGLLTRSIMRGAVGPTERVGGKETIGVGVEWECRYQTALGAL